MKKVNHKKNGDLSWVNTDDNHICDFILKTDGQGNRWLQCRFCNRVQNYNNI